MNIIGDGAGPAGPGAPGDWLHRAWLVIAELGFSIVTGEDPDDPAATGLVVALRSEPTLRHYDPEAVSYWQAVEGRGRSRHFDRDTPLPIEAPFAWGRITIADRLRLSNQWLSFGGTVRADALDDDTTVIAFSSPAPIQRWSGHSQGLDLLTPEMGAFFARLMIPIDFEPGAEARISGLSPWLLYCVFLQDAERRLARSKAMREAQAGFAQHVDAEHHRIEHAAPGDWAAAETELDALHLVD